MKSFGKIFALLLLATCVHVSTAESLKTKNVILITTDGLRWQEVFNGAEDALISSAAGVANTNAIRKEFWRETPEARRETLLPFFWKTIATRGQLFGNTNKGSIAQITNGKKFSYPGYNEIFTGHADPRVNSNDKFPNPNTNVFEWLQKRPGFRKPIPAFANWDVFPFILNRDRSGLLVWTGLDKPKPGGNARLNELAEIVQDSTQIWDNMTFDSFMFHAAKDYLKSEKPRVMYVGFGETDEWAHMGRYDNYLLAAKNVDRFIQELWDTAQSIPQYRDKTTFIIATDHGRGDGANWKDHGAWVKNAEFIWTAVIGPDTTPLGERTNIPPVTQSQLAATVAALLGENYHAAFPEAGAPIADVIGKMEK